MIFRKLICLMPFKQKLTKLVFAFFILTVNLAFATSEHAAIDSDAILVFIIAHVYLLPTGHSFKEHVMPMINGFDVVELSPEEEGYLEQDEPGRIR